MKFLLLAVLLAAPASAVKVGYDDSGAVLVVTTNEAASLPTPYSVISSTADLISNPSRYQVVSGQIVFRRHLGLIQYPQENGVVKVQAKAYDSNGGWDQDGADAVHISVISGNAPMFIDGVLSGGSWYFYVPPGVTVYASSPTAWAAPLQVNH